MQFLRKLVLGITLFIYPALLLLLPTMVSLNSTIIKPSFVKQTLVKAGFYDALSKVIIDQAAQKNPTVASNPILVASFKQAAAPQELQKVIEPPIDGIYKWLDNPNQKFDVSLSIKPLEDNFQRIAQQNLQTQLTSLPPCTTRVTTTDISTLNCIPKGSDVQALIQQGNTQIAQYNGLFGDQQNISLAEPDQAAPADTQATDAAPTADAIKQQTPQINTKKLKSYAKIYHWIKVGTPVVIILTALSTIGIVLLSSPMYKGARRAGVLMLIFGVTLLGTSFIMGYGLKTVLPTPTGNETLAAAGSKAADIIGNKVISVNHTFTIIYLVVGVVGIIAGIVLSRTTKKKSGKPEAIESEDMLGESKDLGEKKSSDKAAKLTPPPIKEEPQEKKINIS